MISASRPEAYSYRNEHIFVIFWKTSTHVCYELAHKFDACHANTSWYCVWLLAVIEALEFVRFRRWSAASTSLFVIVTLLPAFKDTAQFIGSTILDIVFEPCRHVVSLYYILMNSKYRKRLVLHSAQTIVILIQDRFCPLDDLLISASSLQSCICNTICENSIENNNTFVFCRRIEWQISIYRIELLYFNLWYWNQDLLVFVHKASTRLKLDLHRRVLNDKIL